MDKLDQNINTLQKLWQDQKLKDINMNAVIAPDSFIVKQLRAFEKLQLRINAVKITLLAMIMGSFTWYLFKYSDPSPSVLLGLFWIGACLTIFTILYLMKQFKASRLNFSLPTIDFIDLAIEKVQEQNKIFRLIFPFLVLGLIAGLNIICLLYTSPSPRD